LLAAVCAAAAAASAAYPAPRVYVGFLDDQALRWGPGRHHAWDEVSRSQASVVRTIVDWAWIAKHRPQHPASPFDPAYHFGDLDEFVRAAQARGVEVLFTFWGTPGWANGGRGPNVPPRRASDFRAFTRAVAKRYSGSFQTLPFVRFMSVWNEPNSPRFLTAFDAPQAYAALARAGYEGIKAGSPHTLVAVGETAARHSPAAFVTALARIAPHLRFDAWAHHPYPVAAGEGPEAGEPWPDVGVTSLGRFETLVSAAFRRASTPLWVTEYAESRPAASTVRIEGDLQRAVTLAARVPSVTMFVWFMLQNHRGQAWQSGLAGTPAFAAFQRVARAFDPRNVLVAWPPRSASLVVSVPALELRARMRTSFGVLVDYHASWCGRVLEEGREWSQVMRDGFVRVRVESPQATPTRVDVVVRDLANHVVRRRVDVVATTSCPPSY
jgi:hypothetical protein